MGSGKSGAAITYMNEHPDNKYIYITPYLEEAARINVSCPDLGFVEPSNKICTYGFRKQTHTAYLIDCGKNIATTHQSFKNYTDEMLNRIREQEYTLIIDEDVTSLETLDFNACDMQLLIDGGYIQKDGNKYSVTDKEYSGDAFSGIVGKLKSRPLESTPKKDGSTYEMLYFWTLPPELISSFKDVFILTYMFSGQSLYQMLRMNDMQFNYIGLSRDDRGMFRFADKGTYVPEYVRHLDELIEIVNNDRINSIGDEPYSLSKNWYDTKPDGVEQLKKNLVNCSQNIWKDSKSSTRLWGTFKSAQNKLRGKGYTNSFLVFNARATNAYRGCEYLAYVINVFMSVDERVFYKSHGVDVDDNAYALSTMVQWIWRSAIRDGKKIHLFLPSKRMRGLLTRWIADTMKGGDMTE